MGTRNPSKLNHDQSTLLPDTNRCQGLRVPKPLKEPLPLNPNPKTLNLKPWTLALKGEPTGTRDPLQDNGLLLDLPELLEDLRRIRGSMRCVQSANHKIYNRLYRLTSGLEITVLLLLLFLFLRSAWCLR